MPLCMLILAAQLTSSCTSYHDELKQKLADLPSQQRRIVLAQECRDLILANRPSNNPALLEHVQRMKDICEKMTGEKISLTQQQPAKT